LKDCLLCIDDFAPGGSRRDVADLHSKANDLLRAAGNLAGRSRMNYDTSLRPTYWPRGLLVSSGEDVPGGHSVRARLAIEQLGPDDINIDKLSHLQAAAREGLLAQTMAGYVQWIAGRDDLGVLLARRQQELRAMVRAAHRRTPDITAGLMLGIDMFLRFAVDAGAISKEEVQNRTEAAWRVLTEAASAQTAEQRDEDPVEIFLDAVPEVLSSGRAHIARCDGSEPCQEPFVFGWIRRADKMAEQGSDGSFTSTPQWMARGRCIGWLAGSKLWLSPDAAIAEINAMLHEQGRVIPISRLALGRRLREAGRLVEPDGGTTKPVWIGGATVRVFVLDATKVLGITSEPETPF